MNLTIPDSPPSDNSIDGFLQEVKAPTNAALDGPAPPAQEVTYDIPNIPVPDAAPPRQEPGQPIFNDDDVQPTGEPAAQPEPAKKPNFTTDYKKQTLRSYLDMEENASAWLGAQITKSGDTAPFKYSDRAKEMLLLALEPYMDVIIEALPAWIPVLLIYIGMKTDQVSTGMKIIKTNKANAAGRQDKSKMQSVANMVDTGIQRKNFVLYIDGFYRNDRSGNYIKDRNGEGRAKLEKPSMDDLQKIMAVPTNNAADLICAAFDISQADFARLGIKIKTD